MNKQSTYIKWKQVLQPYVKIMRKALIVVGTLLLLLKLAVFVRDVSKSRTKLQQQNKQEQNTVKQTNPLKESIVTNDTSPNDTAIYNVVEDRPYLQSCATETNPQQCSEKKLLTFYYKHVKYKGINSKEFHPLMVFSFIIEKDGTVSNFKELKGKGQTNMKEVISQLPPWVPGKINGQPKRVKFQFPMRIRLEE